MYDQIKHQLRQIVPLNEEELDVFTKKLVPKKLKRKEFLWLEGDVCRTVYFVNEGCLRYFHNADGTERTGQFFFENSWYTDYRSFLSEQPSLLNAQALEPTQLWALSKTDLYELYNQHPKIERFGRIMAENAYLGVHKRNLALRAETPEERYLKLIQERPKVVERISLQYIASYLGIQPESLSRIRKRLFDNR